MVTTLTKTVRGSDASTKQTASSSQSVVVALLFLSFAMPFYFYLGTLRLSPYRLILLIYFFPTLIWWARGSAGKIYSVDLLVIAFTIWSALAMVANYGLSSRLEFIGIRTVETMAPYFIARTMIRDIHTFRKFAFWFFVAIAMMLPFSIYQNFTERAVLFEFFGKFMNVYNTIDYRPRLGLYRAQGAMPHPILYGVFTSTAFALVWYAMGLNRSQGYRLSRSGLVVASVFTSLSSGAYLSVAIQMALMSWKTMFSFLKKKWNVLGGLFIAWYMFIEIFADRSPAQIFARYLTLNSATAWNRIYIFTYATDDIMRNPVFGIGQRSWTRPAWLLPSVDNFWLVIAMQYGLPAFAFVLAVVLVLIRKVGRADLTGDLAQVRLGFMFSVIGLSVAAITVHLWDATFSMFFFLLGSGVWLIDAKGRQTRAEAEPQPSRQARKIRYTRFE